jgi:hypothetical protein
VIEFYSLFYNEPVGKRIIRVCTDQACALKGADEVLHHLCSHHGLEPGQTTRDRSLTIEASPCLGLCEQAPAALVNEEAETNIDLENDTYELGRPKSIVGGSIRLLTANCGNESTSLAQFGKYPALTKALGMQPEELSTRSKPADSSGVAARRSQPGSNGKARQGPLEQRSM